MSGLERKNSNKVFDGILYKYTIKSSSALGGLPASFNVFVPITASTSKPAPVLIYLSGLTCTEDNATQKAPTLFEAASKEGIAIVLPDTSPRGAKIEGEDESYDFGSGAGFYLKATKEPWSKHYNMEEYVLKELPQALKVAGLPLDVSRRSITGHSMGGHGALSLYLRNPGVFRSSSAFSPICNPTQCNWGKKAFEGYLQGGVKEGEAYDSMLLLAQVPIDKRKDVNILIDSGLADNFAKEGQLRVEEFAKVAMSNGFDADRISIRLQDGYDHSYYFIATFAAEHVHWHAKFLKG
ncbi:S-formylglutathione hydrol [Tilletiaria anomala UBC 951]|uniref:S-formylglutathione hydrolase n=1 Tax=Tilletiaria anomala (strain ATCC 24038 / CBS 436.72 / UBC 951) TaxID=1037660 RepID=A0A066WGW7_TILAU|nr:S-formylglutathione hydrol [Tilletiaria anomala UBC 951]KDN49950.1 S-formylglutathione hydrol [Tilletiaria anomala UBC 951]